MYFTNSLIRFRSGEGVMPEWALLVFRRHMHAGRFRRESRITTNIAHLALGRFRTVEFPVPPMDEQKAIVTEVERRLSLVDAAGKAVEANVRKAERLRRSLLSAAFRGCLVRQDSNDEPGGALLERIKAQREVSASVTKPRKSQAKKSKVPAA